MHMHIQVRTWACVRAPLRVAWPLATSPSHGRLGGPRGRVHTDHAVPLVPQQWGDKPHIDCARLLLEAGCNLEIKDKNGKTALDWCGSDNSLIAMVKDEEELRGRAQGSRFW